MVWEGVCRVGAERELLKGSLGLSVENCLINSKEDKLICLLAEYGSTGIHPGSN